MHHPEMLIIAGVSCLKISFINQKPLENRVYKPAQKLIIAYKCWCFLLADGADSTAGWKLVDRNMVLIIQPVGDVCDEPAQMLIIAGVSCLKIDFINQMPLENWFYKPQAG